MNSEEKQYIFELCEQYTKIFYLGDKLTFLMQVNIK